MQRILTANLKKVLGKARLLRQPFVFEIRRGELSRVLAGMNGIADSSPTGRAPTTHRPEAKTTAIAGRRLCLNSRQRQYWTMSLERV